MGLDAYLHANSKKEPNKRTEIGYWRKANQIQAWIEKEFPDFENCDTVTVSIDQLRDLKTRCLRIAARENPQELLPTTNGFFFGSTDYDGYYMEQLERTIEIIARAEQIHEMNPDVEFSYHANW